MFVCVLWIEIIFFYLLLWVWLWRWCKLLLRFFGRRRREDRRRVCWRRAIRECFWDFRCIKSSWNIIIIGWFWLLWEWSCFLFVFCVCVWFFWWWFCRTFFREFRCALWFFRRSDCFLGLFCVWVCWWSVWSCLLIWVCCCIWVWCVCLGFGEFWLCFWRRFRCRSIRLTSRWLLFEEWCRIGRWRFFWFGLCILSNLMSVIGCWWLICLCIVLFFCGFFRVVNRRVFRRICFIRF